MKYLLITTDSALHNINKEIHLYYEVSDEEFVELTVFQQSQGTDDYFQVLIDEIVERQDGVLQEDMVVNFHHH